MYTKETIAAVLIGTTGFVAGFFAGGKAMHAAITKLLEKNQGMVVKVFTDAMAKVQSGDLTWDELEEYLKEQVAFLKIMQDDFLAR
jgi:hypothetical protein